MTSLSTVLGILPIALGLGAGAESRIPMGVAVIGGMVIGTVADALRRPRHVLVPHQQEGARLSVHLRSLHRDAVISEL